MGRESPAEAGPDMGCKVPTSEVFWGECGGVSCAILENHLPSQPVSSRSTACLPVGWGWAIGGIQKYKGRKA